MYGQRESEGRSWGLPPNYEHWNLGYHSTESMDSSTAADGAEHIPLRPHPPNCRLASPIRSKMVSNVRVPSFNARQEPRPRTPREEHPQMNQDPRGMYQNHDLPTDYLPMLHEVPRN
ncbi:unnamed protein product [Arabidopsis thaliana]|uniref:Uncharacterized protein n=1 Tax=Arabidopsis thaliana TaxID=3702 RepID=A0A654EFT7_ARATH|nr:unnamed protein product [Arabidopsis thaliana]